MHSISSVRSAGGAANYFAKDNYYTVGENAEAGVWGGAAARELGLEGVVEPEQFEKVLNGHLPDGEKVGQIEGRRLGLDLTFSMPKSASLLAYVTGDNRIAGANYNAVKAAMGFVERTLAEGRNYDKNPNGEPQRTGNLLYALFAHDTSRALDPQGHIHAVVANVTKMLDGSWKALWNEAIWKNNTTIGQVYHAALRAELQKLGYETEAVGKHGTFEIKGVPKDVRDEFSQRTLEINKKIDELNIKSEAGKKMATLSTRNAKVTVEDRAALVQDWKDRAAAMGFDGKDLHQAALERVNATATVSHNLSTTFSEIRDRLGTLFKSNDPLTSSGVGALFLSGETVKAQHATASAIRHLSEREAAFAPRDVISAALGFQINGLQVDKVEERLGQLLKSGDLIAGKSDRADGHYDMLTTPHALRMEQAVLDKIDAGQGQGRVIVAPETVMEVIAAAAPSKVLNAGQMAAAVMILSGNDRMTLVQGVAGAGKSTMINAVSRVGESAGVRVLGLAFQNKMVADLRGGGSQGMSVEEMKSSGIEAQTIASFAAKYIGAANRGQGPRFESARAELKDTVLLVDESSMVSTRDMLSLIKIAEAFKLDGLHFIGDRQQLSAIDQGKTFAVAQAAGAPMARMDENIRQRNSPLLTAVAGLSNEGYASQALDLLNAHGKIVEDKSDHVAAAASLWLSLTPEQRERTAIFTAGRDDRAQVNQHVQEGLLREGTLQGEGLKVTTLQSANTTREELRHASTYRPGQILEARQTIAEIGLPKGAHEVRDIDAKGRVTVGNGTKSRTFDPSRIDPTNRHNRMSLSEQKELKLHDGETILWREKDKDRDIAKSTYAKVLKADRQGITVELADKREMTLKAGDPMLQRLDLGYALNAHMAQGMTKPETIEVISGGQTNLATQRTQNVLNTRASDDMRIVTDDFDRLKGQLDRTPGNKTSALETIGQLQVDAKPNTGPIRSDATPVMPDHLKELVAAVPKPAEPAPAPVRDPPVLELKKGFDLA